MSSTKTKTRAADRTPRDASTASAKQASPAKEFYFQTPFAPHKGRPELLLELRIRRFAAEIKEKPRWWSKISYPDIVARWTREIVEHDLRKVNELWGPDKQYWRYTDEAKRVKQWPREAITDAQLRYLFDELRYHADQRDVLTGIHQTAVPMVYQSSELIPEPLKETVMKVAQKLESIPDDQKDWHPGSNGQVLDLIHPSLYCLRIGGSSVLASQPDQLDPLRPLSVDEYFKDRPDMSVTWEPDSWWGTAGPLAGRVPFQFTVSQAYQWLPTDFYVSGGGAVSPRGYINNLNPSEHPAAYAMISSALERFIPLFERVLSDHLSLPPPSPFPPVRAWSWYGRGNLWKEKWYGDSPYERGWHYSDHPEAEAWRKRHPECGPYLPDALPFKPPPSAGKVAFTLKGRTIQVIVKMANLVLSPENPSYPGGSWHVEGMHNERIVATGLYYYDNENITESRLTFRAAVGDGVSPGGLGIEAGRQDDEWGHATVYGLERGSALNQELGSIVATEDKCVAFPNVYQHRVAPFELADRARPGHRKILAFFLVDPLIRVLSTSEVPPQQAEWYRDAFEDAARARQLPQEITEIILGYALEHTVTIDQAKADRRVLMKERSKFVTKHNKNMFEDGFDMCEH